MAKRERKAYTVAEREMQIIGALAVNVQNGGSWWLTTADFARYLKMTPSTHLRLILNNMVVEGLLDSRRESDPGIAKYRVLFSIPDNDMRKRIKLARVKANADKKQHSVVINTRQGSFFEVLNG